MTTKTTTTGGRLREGREEKEEARKEASKQARKEEEGGRKGERATGLVGERRIWQQVGGIEADPSAGNNLKITRGGRMRGYACGLQTQ